MVTATNLASLLSDAGRAAEAEAMEERIFESKRRVLGPEQPFTLTAVRNLGVSLHNIGRVRGPWEP